MVRESLGDVDGTSMIPFQSSDAGTNRGWHGARLAARRMAMLAFTSADLLMEIGLDGTILFAEGAFRRHFGRTGEAFLHHKVETLFEPSDRKIIEFVLALLSSRLRVPPVIVRLGDDKRTPLVLNVMRGGDQAPGVFLTLSQPPSDAIDLQALTMHSAAEFADQAVEHMLTDTGRASLTFLEVEDRAGGLQQTDIHRALSQAVPNETKIGDMAPGRFGILDPKMEPAELERRVVEALHRFGRSATVSATAISLATGDLPADKAVSTLKLLLEAFMLEGAPGIAATANGNGLAGAIEEVRSQSRRIASAIREKQFELEYQPICDVKTRDIHHYEALIRPYEGLPPAYRFVRLAEEAGLSKQLDLAILAKATEVAKGRNIIAVNISGYSVQNKGFQEAFLGVAKDHHRNLIVELTETAEIQERETANRFFHDLNRAGIEICFDDFGAGAAGLQYIRDFPVDFVKIDGSYVRAALTNGRQRAILYSMIEMAKAISVKTIAEFVETEEQAQLMDQMGVGFIQGWLVGKPAPLPTMERLLRASGLRR